MPYSQHGEDVAVARRFHQKPCGYFVEVGALDGVKFSNTFLLERELGWTGVLIEADPVQAEACMANRGHALVIAKAVTSPQAANQEMVLAVVEGENALSTLAMSKRTLGFIRRLNAAGLPVTVSKRLITTITLDAALTQAGTPQQFDFISIDIEGHEWPALQGFSLGERWYPTVLMIESNTLVPDFRVIGYLANRGYGYRRSVGVINLWFEPGKVFTGLFRLAAHVAWNGVRPSLRRLLKALGIFEIAKSVRDSLRLRFDDLESVPE